MPVDPTKVKVGANLIQGIWTKLTCIWPFLKDRCRYFSLELVNNVCLSLSHNCRLLLCQVAVSWLSFVGMWLNTLFFDLQKEKKELFVI